MIRMIVAVLLAVNLVLLAWIAGDKSDERDPRPQPGGDLKLLSEVRHAPAPQPVTAQPPEAASKPAEVAQAQPATQTPVAQPVPVAEPSKPAAPATQPEQRPESAMAEQRPQVTAPQQPAAEVKPLPRPPAAASSSVVPAVAQTQEATPSVKEQEPANLKPTCYSFGPLEERLAAIGIMARLKEQTTDQNIRQEGSKHTEGYRVLIRTAKTEEEARALEQKILAAGIMDIWRISRGEDQNAISMGMYSQQPNAAKRAEQAKGLGFDAAIEAKVTDKERFWIDFASGEPKLTPADLGLKPGPGQSLKKRPCNGKGAKRP